MLRKIFTILAAMVAVLGLGAVLVAATGSGSSVTRARLERSLPVTFANVYADQARIQGRTDVTPASLHVQAMCGKHGAENVDYGPGGDWVCLMSWTDPERPMPPEGYGKFELNVHSNGCYTALGQTKLTGFLTMTDAQGREVTNPVFEFDSCFDPGSDNTPTGVIFPSLFTVTSTSLSRDADGKVAVQISCGTGDGCKGTITGAAGDTSLGTTNFAMQEESTATLALPDAVPGGATEVTLTIQEADVATAEKRLSDADARAGVTLPSWPAQESTPARGTTEPVTDPSDLSG